MKQKSTLLLLTLFVVGIATFSCSERQETTPPFITIDTKTVNFNAGASTREIPVKTSLQTWDAAVQSDAQAWLTARKSGANLSVAATENKGAEPRRGTIKVTGDALSETVVVEQLGIAPAILLSSEVFSLSADGGDIKLEITSNIEYDIIIPADAAWIKAKPEARAAGDMVKKEHAWEVAFNPQDGERKTEIAIKHKESALEKKVPVVQKGQNGYEGGSGNEIKDDLKVPVSRATASSFQQGGEIEKSFDGNFSTLYHSKWDNSADNYFPITIEYFFENQESIDYLIYHPRQSGPNGLFKEVEIWVATEESPTLVKLKDHDFKGSSSATKVIFDKPIVKPKSVKFVIKSGAGNGKGFASCAEMEFYRVNPDNFDPLTLFTDITCSKLKPGITAEEIEKVSNNLYRNIAFYLHKGTYPSEFRVQEFRAWPHPDAWSTVNKTSALSLLDNPTGISVKENEDLIVFVGNTQGRSLSLKVQDLDIPGNDGYYSASYYALSEGVNKLKTYTKGLAYVFYHTQDYLEAPIVKIHFATGTVNGYFDTRKHTASDWKRLLDAANNKYFDVLGEHAHLTFPTDGFRQHAANNGEKLIAAFDELVRIEKEFLGLVKYNRPTVNRAYFHAMYTSYMYSTSYRTAYNVGDAGVVKGLLDVNQLKKSPWGPAHELGHSFQTRPGLKWHGLTEVTNNIQSLWVQTQWGNASRIETEDMAPFNNRYEKAYFNSFVKNTPHPGEGDVFCKLVPFWQIQRYFADARGNTDLYKDLYERVRTSPDKPTPGEQQLEFVRMVCEITNTNLLPFFRKWGFLTPFDKVFDDYGERRFLLKQDQIDRVAAEIAAKGYTSLTEPMEYICDSNWEIFKNRLPVQQGTATKNGKTITMTGWKNAVAYEVYEGDNLIFVSNKDKFLLKENASATTRVLAVAYDGTKTEVKF